MSAEPTVTLNTDLSVKAAGELYASLVQRKLELDQMKAEEKRAAREAKDDSVSDDTFTQPLSRKEKQQRSLESFRDVVINLTGDDLEYVGKRPTKRKKYGKWIDDDTDMNVILTDRPKKRKKTNYNKEFEPELNLLRSIVSDQQKLNADLARRVQALIGAMSKDSGPPSKTTVELVTALIGGRANSLSVIREIGNIKKTIANLIIDDRKNFDKSGFGSNDLTMLGSAVAQRDIVDSSRPSMMFGNDAPQSTPTSTSVSVSDFDPQSWGIGSDMISAHTKYEQVPTKTYVEYHPADGNYRYRTINTDTNEEILDFPNPDAIKIKTFDESNLLARDEFDAIYELVIVK